MNASDIHFTITLAGLGTVFLTMLGIAYRLGRYLQRLDSHIEESNAIHQAIDSNTQKLDDRVRWLERQRR